MRNRKAAQEHSSTFNVQRPTFNVQRADALLRLGTPYGGRKFGVRSSKFGVRSRGFTLTEVLLVVVVIALVAGAGGGIYVGTHKRAQVEVAARDFLLTAQYARVMAIEQQKRYTLQLDAVNNGFCLVTTQWDDESGQAQQVIVRDYYCKPVELTGDVRFEDVKINAAGMESAETDEGDAIIFSPDGSASSAVIQIGDGKTHYAINVDAATGKTTVYFGTVEKIQASSFDLDAE